ncbi:hypothetical protein ACF0H5_014164 [Mactra antiquata]
MEFDDDPVPLEEVIPVEKDEKAKKKVVIDENNQIRHIENTNYEKQEKQEKQKSQFRQNMETTEWPWRIACVCFCLGLMFHIISYGTPYWIEIQVASGDAMHAGIWSTCVDGSGCSFRNSTTVCYNAVRGFGGIGVLFGIVTLFLLYYHSQYLKNRRHLGLVAAGFSFGSALSIQIAAGAFGQSLGCNADESGTATGISWGWSLALAFVSVIMIVGSGLAFLILELRGISRDSGGRKRPWNGRGVIVT